MDKNELMVKIEEQNKIFSRSNAEVTAAYFAGEEVEYQPYGLNGPDFAIANYLGYKTTDLFSNPECQQAVGEEKAKLGLSGNTVMLEGKSMATLVGSGLVVPENGIPRNSSQVLKDYKDFDKIKDFDFLGSDLYKETIANGKAMVQMAPEVPMAIAVNGPITFAACIRPIEMILKDMRKDPDNIHMLMDWVTDKLIEWIELYYKEIGQGDLTFMEPVATNDLISPDQFREFVLPYIARMIERTKEVSGNGVNCHICGHTRGFWEDLGGLGLKAFSVDNAEDMKELKEVLGDKLVISGNIPPVDVLRYGTIDDVIESVIETMKKAADSPKGFILDAGCMITPGTPRENLWAIVYAVRQYGQGAKIGAMPRSFEEDGGLEG